MNQTPELRARMEWLKSQIKWKVNNKTVGNELDVRIDVINKEHNFVWPQGTEHCVLSQHYIMLLSKCYYAESVDPVFGQTLFSPKMPAEWRSVVDLVVEYSKLWFINIFCGTNFPDVWQEHINSVELTQTGITDVAKDYEKYLEHSMLIALKAFFSNKDCQHFIKGRILDTARIFLNHDPQKTHIANVIDLAQQLILEFSQIKVEYLFMAEKGGFWLATSKKTASC